MTTGQPIKLPSDRNKYNNEFMESLQMQIDLNQKNLEVNRLYKETGQLPASTQMMDTRSNEEKLADIHNLKQSIISDLAPIAEPMFASAVIQGVIDSPLNVDNSLFRYLAQNASTFAQTLSKKYKFGIAGDANDVTIMVQFLEDAFVKTKNTFQSIKGYINSNTNEGNKSRSNILSANDTDNIIAELSDIQKRCDIFIKDLINAGQGALTQLIRDVHVMVTSILRFLPNTQQLATIINDLKFIGAPNQQANYIYAAFDILKQLPKLSAVQILLDRIDRGVRNTDARMVREASNSLMLLFQAFDPVGPNGVILNRFRDIFINAERRESQLNNIKSSYDISAEDAQRREESRAQRVYIVNPANDPGNVVDVAVNGGPYMGPGAFGAPPPVAVGGVAPQMPVGGPANGPPMTQQDWQNYIAPRVIGMSDVQLAGLIAGMINNPNLRHITPQIRAGLTDDNATRQEKEQSVLMALMLQYGNPQYGPHQNVGNILRPAVGLGLGKKVKKGRGLYSPFGDSEINHKNLENNILTLRRKSKTNYMDLPSKHISKHMKNIIHNIVGGKIANFEDINNLNDEERNYLNKVINKTNLQDRLSVPAPSKDQAEKDNHQWEVMRGEIMAGNDSHELVKKFKILTMKLTRQGLLPKNEVMELFEDLVNLGY